MAVPYLPDDCEFYRWRDIKQLTDNFSKENFIDLMQFGKLYRGRTKEGNHVTVKLVTTEKTYYKHNFSLEDLLQVMKREVAFSNRQRSKGYPNFSKVMGYCYAYKKDCLAVVYDLNPLDTLHNLLKNDALDWRGRMNVARKLASFLADLHSHKKQCIVYNIDPAHIMIDQVHNPVLLDYSTSDGGMFSLGKPRYYVGAMGYNEPRSFVSGYADRVDVFSFGLVLISLISKRIWEFQTLEDYVDYLSKIEKGGDEIKKLPDSLPDWARKSSKSGCSLVHNSFKEDPGFNDKEGVQVSELALRCINEADYTKRPLRPTMGIVLRVLLLCCGADGLEPSLKQFDSPAKNKTKTKKRRYEVAKCENKDKKRFRKEERAKC